MASEEYQNENGQNLPKIEDEQNRDAVTLYTDIG